MRYIYLLLITFIFASCGNQKMRLVPTNTTKQKVVEIADIPSLKKNTVNVSSSEERAEKPKPEAENLIAQVNEIDGSVQGMSDVDEVIIDVFPTTVEDSTKMSSREVDAITQEALQAERNGTNSLIFSLLFYAFVIVSFLFLLAGILSNFSTVWAIVSAVFAVLSIVSLILGIVYGIKSLRAQYNTPQGKRRATTGIILSSVAVFLFLINLLLTIF